MSERAWMRGLGLVVVAGALLAASRRAGANDAEDVLRAQNDRCTNRLSIAFTGKTAATFGAPDPKTTIDGLLKSPDFQERFARFINTQFNEAPGAASIEDAPYHMAKNVLSRGAPWSEMFLGKFRLASIASNVAVFDEQNGLGYFRSDEWYKRYEGNEPNGIKIATAYRILNNVVGLRLNASTGLPNTDQSAEGRKAPACAQCHYDHWYALDKVAAILPLKGQAYGAYKGGPQEMLGGKQIANDKELVTALVESENFSVNACRLAFEFLYGREDNKCEGPLLDRCVDAFKAEKTMQSALGVIARDASFCE